MIVLFLGPSASKAEIEHIVHAEIWPPAAQGDVFRAVERGAHAIGVVDGYFNSTPAVWHKEIAWALSRGIPVFGAASMGALRAAELAPLGMRGIGWVYESFASGELEDDDEVAILHAPASLGFVAFSEAMVNVRCTLARAEAEDVLPAPEVCAIERVAKTLFYADRQWSNIMDVASAELSPERIDAFACWLPEGRVDIKRADAITLARTMHAELGAAAEASSAVPPPMAGAPFEPTALVENARRSACSGASGVECAFSPVVDEMRLHDPEWRSREERALLEALALERAAKNRLTLDEASLLAAVARFRDANGLQNEAEVAVWLASRGLSEQHALELLAREARVAQAAGELRSLANRLLLDRMPLHECYEQLAARAAEKQQILKQCSERGIVPSSTFDDWEVLDWYRASNGPSCVSDVPTADFIRVLRREYDYVTLRDAEKRTK